MEIDIYKAKNSPSHRGKIYLMVKSGSDINELPVEIKEKAGELLFFKKMTIKRGEKRIALDSDEAISNIEAHGYHEQGTKIEMQINVQQ